jgi:hypothetical protein
VVWSPVLLLKDGTLLCKGVAQGKWSRSNAYTCIECNLSSKCRRNMTVWRRCLNTVSNRNDICTDC